MFLSVPCIHKLMKLNFAICLLFSLSLFCQQTLGKTYDLRCQNGVMVSDSFESCRHYALSLVAKVDVSGLSAFVTEWQGQIVNDQK